MTTLDGTAVSLQVAATLNNSLDLAVVASAALSQTWSAGLTTGTGAGQADTMFFDQRTIAASTNDDLDLAGSLVGPLGATLTFARVKGLFVQSLAANTNNIVIGGSATNPITTILGGTTPSLTIRPGGFLGLYAPDATAYAVTAGTGDILRVTNAAGGSSVTYNIIIIGSSA